MVVLLLQQDPVLKVVQDLRRMDQRIDLLLPLYLQALHVAPYISIPICVRDRVQTRDIDCSVQLLLVEFDQIFNHLELGLDCLFNLGVLEQRALGRRLLL